MTFSSEQIRTWESEAKVELEDLNYGAWNKEDLLKALVVHIQGFISHQTDSSVVGLPIWNIVQNFLSIISGTWIFQGVMGYTQWHRASAPYGTSVLPIVGILTRRAQFQKHVCVQGLRCESILGWSTCLRGLLVKSQGNHLFCEKYGEVIWKCTLQRPAMHMTRKIIDLLFRF